MIWALKLSSFRNDIDNLDVEINLWADILTFRDVYPKGSVLVTNLKSLNELMMALISPSLGKYYHFPTLRDMKASQEKHNEY